MFTWIVGGPIDVPAGFALVAFAGMLTIVITSFIVKRRSQQEIKNEFELGKMKLHNEDENSKRMNQKQLEVELATLSSKRDIELRKIETGLIEGKVVSSS